MKIKNYDIRVFQLSDTTESDIIEIQQLAYKRSFESNAISINTNNHFSQRSTLHIGAFEGHKIIGYNAFTPHSFIYNKNRVIGYQSGWSVTHPLHRKKGIFFNIINHAKEVLRAQGAEFIFGFPNHNSEPIFTKKLDFTSSLLAKIEIPASPLLFPFFIKNETISPSNIYTNDSKEQFLFKKESRSNLNIIIEEINGDFIWGKILVKNIRGIKLNYFSIGGYSITSFGNFTKILKQLSKRNIQYFQLVTHPKASLNSILPQIKPTNKTEPYIIYDLKETGITASDSFNFSNGIKDVY